MNRFVHGMWPKKPRLLRFHELIQWRQDNEYIVSRYRYDLYVWNEEIALRTDDQTTVSIGVDIAGFGLISTQRNSEHVLSSDRRNCVYDTSGSLLFNRLFCTAKRATYRHGHYVAILL